MSERMTEEEIAELLVRREGRHGFVEVLCSKAHAEIMALRAALKPFAGYGAAEVWHYIDVETPVSLVVEPHIVWLTEALKVWDFYQARAALQPPAQGESV